MPPQSGQYTHLSGATASQFSSTSNPRLISIRPLISERQTEQFNSKTGTDITKCPFCKKGTLVAILGIPKHSGINPYDIILSKRIHNLVQRE